MTPRPGNCHAGLNGGLAVLEHYGDPRALPLLEEAVRAPGTVGNMAYRHFPVISE